MEKTDRQTDINSTDRHCHWSITVFDPEEITLCKGNTFPPFVKGIRGQEEIAPTTGKIHFQGYLRTSQQRFSAIKKLFPSAHIEVPRDVYALKKYVHKVDTAVPGTQVDTIPRTALQSMNETLNTMFKTLFIDNNAVPWVLFDNPVIGNKPLYEDQTAYASMMYRVAVNQCVEADEEQVHQYTSNAIKQAFLLTYAFYEKKWFELRKDLDSMENA